MKMKIVREVVVVYDNSLYSKENIDFKNEPLFFGSGRNVA